ncbi:MAG: hypothetical protein P8X63_05035 [Desulfuromonadaceae bacterium]
MKIYFQIWQKNLLSNFQEVGGLSTGVVDKLEKNRGLVLESALGTKQITGCTKNRQWFWHL